MMAESKKDDGTIESRCHRQTHTHTRQLNVKRCVSVGSALKAFHSVQSRIELGKIFVNNNNKLHFKLIS